MSIIAKLTTRGLICPPKWLPDNVHYLTIMGSYAYGVNADTSDFDVTGFCTPPKYVTFPHLTGEITDFSTPGERFLQWQQHHVKDPDACGGAGREYDFSVYSIVRYFRLCMENNPNMIDSLFTPRNCVLFATQIGNMVRERRRSFLHKGCWPKFKGYAYSQLHKLQTKDPIGKRKATVDKFGYDVKFGYHTVRLVNECAQILTEGDLDLWRDNEQLKSIRRGEWTEDQVRDWFKNREQELNRMYAESKLPWGPDEPAIRQLLIDCLEQHYGSLDKCVVNPDRATQALREVAAVVDRYRNVLAPSTRVDTSPEDGADEMASISED